MTQGNKPNLFCYGHKELSQDAMICWLLDWANEAYADVDKALHECGQAFARALFGKRHGPDKISKVELGMQVSRIDVLAWVNDKYAILIEDKTDTGRHDNQLKRYHEMALSKKLSIGSNLASDWKTLEISDDKFFPIFLKTGNMPKAVKESIEHLELDPKYKVFERKDFLNALNEYEGDNPILLDFRQYLRDKEDDFNSYKQRKDFSELTWEAWQGLFCCLEDKLQGCWGWDYVPNPSGGFHGLWWHWHDINSGNSDDSGIYLQLEQEKLCFKISVADKSNRSSLRNHWHEKVIEAEKFIEGITVTKPTRFGTGHHMTVALMEGEWLQFNNSGVDIDATVKILKQAEEVLDKAIET